MDKTIMNARCVLFYIFIVTATFVDMTESCRGGSLICKYYMLLCSRADTACHNAISLSHTMYDCGENS